MPKALCIVTSLKVHKFPQGRSPPSAVLGERFSHAHGNQRDLNAKCEMKLKVCLQSRRLLIIDILALMVAFIDPLHSR